MTRRLIRLLTLLSSAAAVVLTAVPAQAIPLEAYASYQPQTRCSPKAKPGQAVTVATTATTFVPTVEIIRGDKRAHEVVRQEQ